MPISQGWPQISHGPWCAEKRDDSWRPEAVYCCSGEWWCLSQILRWNFQVSLNTSLVFIISVLSIPCLCFIMQGQNVFLKRVCLVLFILWEWETENVLPPKLGLDKSSWSIFTQCSMWRLTLPIKGTKLACTSLSLYSSGNKLASNYWAYFF